MKQIFMLFGLILIVGMGQSFVPSTIDDVANPDLIENYGFFIDDRGNFDRDAPAVAKYYMLNMYDADESTSSTDYYSNLLENKMIEDRNTWCPSWNHWKQSKKVGTSYNVYDTGMCEAPGSYRPAEDVSSNAVALIISNI